MINQEKYAIEKWAKINGIVVKITLHTLFGLIFTLLYSFISAELGFFSTKISSFIFFITLIASILLDKKWPFIPIKTLKISLQDFIFIFVLFAFAIWFYWPPSEYILGGWDPGVYLASGSCILKHHSINFFDPFLASLSAEERRVFVSPGFGLFEFFPGMRIMNSPNGNLLGPQFFHMYPTLLAWVSSLTGLKGSLAVNPIIGLLSILVIYTLYRVFTDSWLAVFGTTLLFTNPVQIWMARFQNSEMLSQLGFLLGFVFLFCAYSHYDNPNENKKWLFTTHIASGLCYWISLLTRYDLLLVVVSLFAMGIISLAWEKTPLILRQARCTWTIFLGVGIVHTFIHQKMIAYRYYPLSRIFEPGVIIVTLISIVIALGVHFLWIQIEEIWKRWNIYIRWISVACVILIVAYAAFIRPHNLELGWERLNFLSLSSFVTVLVIVLALFGISASLLKSKRFHEGAFMLAGLLVTVIVIRNKFIDSFYLWGARRFIPVVFPFLFISASFGAKYILEFANVFLIQPRFHSTNRWLRISFPIFLSIVYLLMTQPNRKELHGYRDFFGLTKFFKEISKKIPKADLIVTQERGVAEVLHFYYDRPAVYMRNTDQKQLRILRHLIIKRLKKNQRVLILTQNENLFEALKNIKLQTLDKFTWRGKRLNDSRTGFPKGTKERGFDLLLLDVSMGPNSRNLN